jgi:D-beta-D-heptose 7-phosphate kinase/D-beta-D-heptose 1-phosphate adenosyltransferase
MSYHLVDAVQRLGRPRVLVLGDLILDRYIWGDAERISQEAPVITLREERQEVRLGGAANVAQMLRGLEADVTCVGVIGTDVDAPLLRGELERRGIDCAGVIADPSRPTTVKQRYLGHAAHRHPHQMLRVDREVREAVPAPIAQEMLRSVLGRIDEFDAVLISDYAKGVCTPAVVRPLIECCRSAGVPVLCDPPSDGQCARYVGVTAITPNRTETGRMVGRRIATRDDAFAAGEQICRELKLSHIFVTLDSDGVALVTSDGRREMHPTRKREVCDITGAGDMVLAMIGVGTAAGIPPSDLCKLANVAGGLEVEQIGVVTISREEILADLLAGSRSASDKVITLEEVGRHTDARRKIGQTIVLTNGCFDLLHVGHVSYLEQAAREGDCLVVALNSDASVRQLGKGGDRPIFDQDQRAAMLAALESVDYVVVFHEATPHAVIGRIKPDVLVKGGTYSREEIVGWELVEQYGGIVKPMGEVPGLSTTRILQRIRGEDAPATIPHPASPPATPERKAG